MKLIQTIKQQLKGLSTSISRFPVSTLLSFILFTLLVMLNERSIDGSNTDVLEKMAIVTTLGFFLSVSLTQILERIKTKLPKIPVVLAGTLGFMAIYYFFFLKEINNVTMIRSGRTLVFLIITVFYTLKKKDDTDYEHYVMKIFSGFFITFLYAGVLFLGIAFIIFTVNALFDANIDGKWYLYSFYASTFIFGSPLLLSKLPEKDEMVADTPYSKVFRALLLYIVIPLIIIYTVILYVYFVQILVTQEWPRGLVSNLVLWYAAFSVGVIFFIYPIVEEAPIARLFKTWFPRAIIPILVMMFVSIGLRINQYGFTESRYYVVLLGLFVLGSMVYFSIIKKSTMVFIPIALSFFVLISVYGPLSALEVSYRSQNQRLTEILQDNGMLSDNVITAKNDLPVEAQKNIASITSFFINRDIEKMKYVDPTFTLSNFSTVFGFTHKYDYEYNNNQDYYYVSSDISYQPVFIKGYDYLFNVDSYDNNITLDGYKLTLKNKTTLVITKDNQVIFEENLDKELLRIISAYEEKAMDTLDRETAVIKHQDSAIDVKIILNNLSARKSADGTPVYDSVSLLVLFTP